MKNAFTRGLLLAAVALAIAAPAHAQSAYGAGYGISIIPVAGTPPSAPPGRGRVWIDSTSSNNLKYTTPAGATITLGAGGGGGGSFATIYSATPSDNIVELNSAGGGLEFDDAATPITAPFISGYPHGGSSGNSYFLLGSDGLTLSGRGRATGAPPEVLYIQNAGASAIAASTPSATITIDFGTTQTWTGGGSWTNPQRWVDVDANPVMNFASSTTVPFQSTWHIAAPLCGTNGTCTRMPALELTEGGVFVSDASSPIAGKLLEITNNARSTSYFSISSSTVTTSVPIVGNLGATTVTPTWNAITYNTSPTTWSDYGAPYSGTAWTKTATGLTCVRIAAHGGTNGTAIGTLPLGSRPDGTLGVIGFIDTTVGLFTISAAGVILPVLPAAGNTVATGNICFMAEH